MLKLSKINPAARAIGTVGVVAGLVGVVTFANFTSNAVALGPDNVTTASAVLEIGDAGCGGLNTSSTPGFTNVTNFSITNPASVTFCLDNTGGVPLAISGSVSAAPGTLEGNAAAQNTTLSINCGPDSAVSGTLNTSWNTTFPTALAANGGNELCTAKLTLNPNFNGPNQAIPTFNINFVGTEPTPTP